MGLSRLALHAGCLEIPYNNQQLTLHTPIPEDLRTVFEQVPWWDEAVTIEPKLMLTSQVQLTNMQL